jgi:phosphate transport system substrate-binding protein
MAVAANLFEAAIVTGGLTQRDEERGLVGEPLGHVAVAVIVHERNPVTTISRSALQRFFTGMANDWAEVGTASLATRVVSLPPADPIGARALTIALPADHLASTAVLCDEIDEVVRQVAASAGGIGLVFLRVPFPAGVRVLAVDGITPTPLAVVNGTYPLEVPIQFVTKGMRSDRATRVLLQLRTAAPLRALLVQ